MARWFDFTFLCRSFCRLSRFGGQVFEALAWNKLAVGFRGNFHCLAGLGISAGTGNPCNRAEVAKSTSTILSPALRAAVLAMKLLSVFSTCVLGIPPVSPTLVVHTEVYRPSKQCG